ncbi:MAG: hypothetical protein JO090_03015 [Rhizobacter sp.]|nr:hypothetical protein [Rhizobacter sp.]
MPLHLDHTIIFARDREAGAALLAAVLVPWAAQSGVRLFSAVCVSDGLTLDVDQLDGDVPVQHFCFASTRPRSTPSSPSSARTASRSAARRTAGSTTRSTPRTTAGSSAGASPAARSGRR